MDRKMWKGKGLAEYIESEEENEPVGGDEESWDTDDDVSFDNEFVSKTYDESIGDDEKERDSGQHFEGGLEEYSKLTYEDIMSMEFTTLAHGESFYLGYAKQIGFGVRKRSLQKNVDGMPCVRVMVCQKEGNRDDTWRNLLARQRAPKLEIRENCQAQIRIKYKKSKDRWVVTKFVMEHTHELVPHRHVHFLTSHRKMDEAMKLEIRSFVESGLGTRQIIDLIGQQSGGYEKMGFTRQDVYNYMDGLRGLDCVDGDVRGIVDFFQSKLEADKGFYFNKSISEDNRLGNLFWADSTCKFDYSCFGEVISFDSAFKRNRYDMPLVITSGVNHHHQTIVFCCAILVDSTSENYVWMLSEILNCMGGKRPKAVVTDGEQSMARAIKETFPEAVHRLCSFHIQQTLQRRFRNQNSLTRDFSNIMWKRMDATEFELKWLKMVSKHNLQDNEWVSRMYESRTMWAEAFLKSHFFACTRTTSRCEGLHSYLDKFVKRRLCFHMFMRQFDTVLMRIREEEAYLDHRDRYGKQACRHPLIHLERPAAEVYTASSFRIFKEQLEEVVAYDDFAPPILEGRLRRHYVCRYDARMSVREVVYDADGGRFSCSCQLFESTGFPCRHQLYVMKKERVSDLPETCILKRWTKEAKSSVPQAEVIPVYGADTLCSIRYGVLSSMFRSLCTIAAKTENTFCHIRGEISRLTKWTNDANNGIASSTFYEDNAFNKVVDPIVPSKRTRGGASKQQKSTARKCSICQEAGHTRTKCPLSTRSQGDSTNVTLKEFSNLERPSGQFESTDMSLPPPSSMSHSGTWMSLLQSASMNLFSSEGTQHFMDQYNSLLSSRAGSENVVRGGQYSSTHEFQGQSSSSS